MEVISVMKLEKLVGERFKEKPSDCAVESHALMVRGGYMKYVANGIFSSYTMFRLSDEKEACSRARLQSDQYGFQPFLPLPLQDFSPRR